jgi:ATP-dependent RNA helicase RhlB
LLKKLFGSGKVSSTPEQATVADSQGAAAVSASKRSPRGRSGAEKQKPAEPEWTLDQFSVPTEEGKTRFHDLGLDLRLMHGIADTGFKYCSPIQAVSLPHTLRGNDVIGKAQTGTGKTAAFLITIFNDLLNNPIEEERFAGEPRPNS